MFEHIFSRSARSQNLGQVTGSSTGTVLTTGSGTAKGTAVSLGTTNFTFEYMLVQLTRNSSANIFHVDLLIYDGANEWVIAEDLFYASANEKTANEACTYIALPLHVPTGSELRARVAGTSGSQTIQIVVVGFSTGPSGAPGYTRCERLASPLAVDPGGTANTKTRQEVVASTAHRYSAMLVSIGANGTVSRAGIAAALFDIEYGAASSESVIVPNIHLSWSSVSDMPMVCTPLIFPVDIPSGSRVSVNSQCSSITAGERTWALVLHGFY